MMINGVNKTMHRKGKISFRKRQCLFRSDRVLCALRHCVLFPIWSAVFCFKLKTFCLTPKFRIWYAQNPTLHSDKQHLGLADRTEINQKIICVYIYFIKISIDRHRLACFLRNSHCRRYCLRAYEYGHLIISHQHKMGCTINCAVCSIPLKSSAIETETKRNLR